MLWDSVLTWAELLRTTEVFSPERTWILIFSVTPVVSRAFGSSCCSGGKQCSRPKPWTGLHWTFQRRSRRVVVWCPSQDRAWTASRGSIPPGYGAAIVTWDPPKGNELGQKKTALDIPGPHVHQSLPLSMAPCGAMIGQLLLHSTRIIDDFGENGTNSAFAAQEKIDLKALASWRGVGRHLQNPRSPAVQSSWSS